MTSNKILWNYTLEMHKLRQTFRFSCSLLLSFLMNQEDIHFLLTHYELSTVCWILSTFISWFKVGRNNQNIRWFEQWKSFQWQIYRKTDEQSARHEDRKHKERTYPVHHKSWIELIRHSLNKYPIFKFVPFKWALIL